MFNVNDEINELIDTYNESVEIDYAMEAYNVIADELQNRVNSGELTLEDAEILNDIAYDKYVVEDGHSKKLKSRHNQHAKNREDRFKKTMGYKFGYIDDKGTEHGTVDRGSGKVSIRIPQKGLEELEMNIPEYQTKIGPHYNQYTTKNGDKNGEICMNRKRIRMKGSDLFGAHEYDHYDKYKKADPDEIDLSKMNSKKSRRTLIRTEI